MQNPVNWVQKKTCCVEAFAKHLEESQTSNAFANGGPAVKSLEEEIRNRLGIEKQVIATSNGTSALWAAKAALDLLLSKRLRFATQAFTFPSSAQGYMSDVEIIDIDEGGGLSLERAEAIKDNIDGIVVTNVFGCVVDIDKYVEWARDNNKFLVFDNAATPMTMYKGKNSLNYGDLAICSLHHTKTLGFGEGGFVVCGPKIEPFVRKILNFGIDNNAVSPKWDRFGGNYKMADISAAAILQFWERDFEKTVKRNREVREDFELMRPDIRMFPSHHDEGTTPIHSCIPILFPESCCAVERLNALGVKARKYYAPLVEGCNNTDTMFKEIVCVPCHADVSTEDVYSISKILSPTRVAVRNCEIDRNESGVAPSQVDNEMFSYMRDFIKRFVRYSLRTSPNGRVLEIAPQDHGVYSQGDTLDIDPNNNCTYTADITKNNEGLITSGSYDTVICTEVLEHTCNPFKALIEIHRILKKGGRAIVTVPCNFRVHGPLPDSWRITEHGIRQMADQCGFKVSRIMALDATDRPLFPINCGAVIYK